MSREPLLAADPADAPPGEMLELLLSMLYGVVTMRYIIALNSWQACRATNPRQSLPHPVQERIDEIFVSSAVNCHFSAQRTLLN